MLFLDVIAAEPFLFGFMAIGLLVIGLAIASVVVLTMIIFALIQRFKKKKESKETE